MEAPGRSEKGRELKTRKNANKVKSESVLNSRVLFRFFLPFRARHPRAPDAYCLVCAHRPPASPTKGRVFATASHAQMKSIKMRVCALKKKY